MDSSLSSSTCKTMLSDYQMMTPADAQVQSKMDATETQRKEENINKLIAKSCVDLKDNKIKLTNLLLHAVPHRKD